MTAQPRRTATPQGRLARDTSPVFRSPGLKFPPEGDTRVLVFAKAPDPGIAKTRLIPLLGAEGAARLQARLTRRAIATAQASGTGRVELWCAPDAGHPFFISLGAEAGVALRSQCGRNLGERMLHAAAESLIDADRVLIVGTDCPLLAESHFRRVREELGQGREAVVVPAADGGYVMLGLTRVDAALFRDVAWGTEGVLAQTRLRLERLAYRYHELPPLPDLDRPEDCLRLSQERPGLWDDLIFGTEWNDLIFGEDGT